MDEGFTLRLFGPEDALDAPSGGLADLLDGLLGHGIVLHGDLWLTVADVDLVFVGLNAVLASPEALTRRAKAPA